MYAPASLMALRTLVTLSAALACTAGAATVRADTCMCAELPGSEDALLFSFDDAAALEHLVAHARSQAAPGPSEPFVLWCVSPDDPRCSPVHPFEGGGGPTSRAEVGRAPAASGVAPAAVHLVAARRDRASAPPLGVVRSIDRPPRA